MDMFQLSQLPAFISRLSSRSWSLVAQQARELSRPSTGAAFARQPLPRVRLQPRAQVKIPQLSSYLLISSTSSQVHGLVASVHTVTVAVYPALPSCEAARAMSGCVADQRDARAWRVHDERTCLVLYQVCLSPRVIPLGNLPVSTLFRLLRACGYLIIRNILRNWVSQQYIVNAVWMVTRSQLQYPDNPTPLTKAKRAVPAVPRQP